MDRQSVSILPVLAETASKVRPANDAAVSMRAAVPKLRLAPGGFVNISQYRDSTTQRGLGSFFGSILSGVKDVVNVGKDIAGLAGTAMALVNPEGGIDQQYSEDESPQGQLEAQETITRTFEHTESRAGPVVDAVPVPGRKFMS